jgi:short chain dehydrogenase
LLFCLKHELRVMTEQGSGSIVNLSSTFGERGGAGAALYSASKHAVKDPRRSVRKTEGDGARFSDREGAISGRRRRYSTTPPHEVPRIVLAGPEGGSPASTLLASAGLRETAGQ